MSQKAIGMTIKQRRELAKNGLIVCLGTLVITGVTRTRDARQIHRAAGWTMVGLSIYHASLY